MTFEILENIVDIVSLLSDQFWIGGKKKICTAFL